MPKAKATHEQLARQARFVFVGTVQKLKAANLAEVHDTANTAVVRVDEIIQSPRVLSHYGGRDITVQLSEPAGLKAGSQAVFFTNAWLFGNDGVAVQSLAHRPPDPEARALHAPDRNPVANLADRDTRAHYADADLVVSGTVSSVRLPAGSKNRVETREHDPDWREAVVDVDQVHKGKSAKKQIVVMFPASLDRQWHHAPKLQPGNRGHFLLHRHKAAAAARGKKIRTAARALAEAGTYVVLHSDDFEPEEQPGRVAKLLTERRDVVRRK